MHRDTMPRQRTAVSGARAMAPVPAWSTIHAGTDVAPTGFTFDTRRPTEASP